MKRFVILALLAILIITLAEDYEGLDELHNIEDIEAFTDGILKGEKEEPNIQLYLLPFHKTDIEMTEELAKDVEQTLNEKFEGSTALALSSVILFSMLTNRQKSWSR
jgi:hypothetical protein